MSKENVTKTVSGNIFFDLSSLNFKKDGGMY